MNDIISNPWVKLAAVVGCAFYLYKKSGNPIVKGIAMTVGSVAVANNLPVVRDVMATRVI